MKIYLPRSLRVKAFAVLFLAAVLATGNVLIVRTLLLQSDSVAASLNLAGKMRMISQRTGLTVVTAQLFPELLSINNKLKMEADFDATYQALHKGGTAFGLTVPKLDPELQVYLHNVNLSWQDYKVALGTTQTTRPSYRMEPESWAAGVLSTGNQLLQQTETLMDQLVLHAQHVQDRGLRNIYGVFFVDILLLLAGFRLFLYYVLRPIRRLEHHANELAKGNYAARSTLYSTNELGVLGQTLNLASDTIERLLLRVRNEQIMLKEAKAMFDGLADTSIVGIYLLDQNLCFTYVNERLALLLGYDRAEMSDGSFNLSRLFTPSNYAIVSQRAKERFLKKEPASNYEMKALRKDGTVVDLEILASLMSLNGQPIIIGMMLDIGKRKQAEISLRRAALIFDQTSEAMVITDADGVVQDINPAVTTVTGYTATELIGNRMSLLSSNRQNQDFYRRMWNSLIETGRWSGDIWNRHKSGVEYIERLTINTTYNEDGSVNCRIGLFSDVTEKRRREALIWRQANFDQLTELPNRQMFYEKLQYCIVDSKNSGLPFALVFLDLDFFKEVNDTFGHAIGDELLRIVAERIRGSVRKEDQVARLGGDEFTLIIQNLKHLDHVRTVCTKVLESVAQPYSLNNNTVHISVSMGVAFYPDNGIDATELLKQADLAMYMSKEKGRNQYSFFSASMQEKAQMRRDMLRDLQQGLDSGQFTLHYQPIVDMQSGLIVKAEALMRWHHPQHGLVSPADFIPLAEDSGLIVPMGDWAFHQAASQLAQWRTELDQNFAVSVNVSPVQFEPKGLDPQTWITSLEALGLPGSAVTLEITERLLMEADEDTRIRLLAFRSSGIQVALDDFGTGYSSLSYLKRFNIDLLKIDQSFVRNLTRQSEDMVLCQAIIVMAHQLGIKVVAEGVNTQEQHEILLEAGCDYGQGFGYARPMPPEELTRVIQEQQNQPLSLNLV